MLRRIRRLGWSPIGLGLFLLGCDSAVANVDDGGTTAATSSGESSSSSTTTTSLPPPAESSESGLPEPVCTPGEVRCSSDAALESCDNEGLAWSEDPCPEETVCVPCEDEACEQDACLGPCDPGAPGSSAGCSFLVARQMGLSEVLGPEIDIPLEEWPQDGLLLLNPSETATANVELFELAFGNTTPETPTHNLVLAPGGAELIPVGVPLPLGQITTLRIGAMTWVNSDRPIVAYSYSPIKPFVGNDSSMLLPETALGLHYVVPSFPPHYFQFQGAGTPSYFDVLATQPNTTVRWLAQFAGTLGSGLPIDPVSAGEWSDDYVVERFEGMRVITSGEEADPHDWDVSGMVVEASAPIYVVGGSRCSAVPEIASPNRGCDPLTEALIPLEAWGSTYVVPPPPPRLDEDHHYRVYGGDAGVTVTTDPPGLPADDYTFASRGDYVDVIVPFGTSFSASADGPIMVVGYLASRDLAGGIGDPAMYQHVSFEQADTHFSIGAPAKWDTQYVQVARANGAAVVELDGVPLSDWSPAGRDYRFTIVAVEPGVHVLDSADPFVATQFAYNNSTQNACAGYDSASDCHTSYAHPVGMRAQRLYTP